MIPFYSLIYHSSLSETLELFLQSEKLEKKKFFSITKSFAGLKLSSRHVNLKILLNLLKINHFQNDKKYI